MLQKEKQVTLMSHTFLAYFFPVKALFENSLTYWYVNASMHIIVCKERGDMTRTRSSGKSDLEYHQNDLEESIQGTRSIPVTRRVRVTSRIWDTCKMSGMCSIHGTYRIQDTQMKWVTISIWNTPSVNCTRSIVGKRSVQFTLRMGETHGTRVIRGIVTCPTVTTHAMQPSAQCLNLAWVDHCPC